MADAEDLKSSPGEPGCGFESHRRYWARVRSGFPSPSGTTERPAGASRRNLNFTIGRPWKALLADAMASLSFREESTNGQERMRRCWSRSILSIVGIDSPIPGRANQGNDTVIFTLFETRSQRYRVACRSRARASNCLPGGIALPARSQPPEGSRGRRRGWLGSKTPQPASTRSAVARSILGDAPWSRCDRV